MPSVLSALLIRLRGRNTGTPTMYDDLKAKWNRDRIGEIRAEFHLEEFVYGLATGALVIILIIFS